MNRQILVLLTLCLFFASIFSFYMAAVTDFVVSNNYSQTTDMEHAYYAYNYSFGFLYDLPLNSYSLNLEPYDWLHVNCDLFLTNGTVYLIICENSTDNVIRYSNYGYVELKNNATRKTVQVRIAVNNRENILKTEITVYHYLRPNWTWFIVATSLSIVANVVSLSYSRFRVKS